MEEQMKRIGRQMGIYMGIFMSFCLSLINILLAGKFTVPGFLISFAISFVICLIIGIFVPVGKITGDLCRKWHLERGRISTRVVESLLSDLIYTPVMTLVMIACVHRMIMIRSHGMAQVPFVPMFLKSLFISFVIAFFLIFIFQPLILRILIKKNGPRE